MTYENVINEDQIKGKPTASDSVSSEPNGIGSTSDSCTSSSGIDGCGNIEHTTNEDISKEVEEECLDDNEDDLICSTSSSLDHCDDLITSKLQLTPKDQEFNKEKFNSNYDNNTTSIIVDKDNKRLSPPNELHLINHNSTIGNLGSKNNNDEEQEEKIVCYNQDLDDEIRNRLDKLNSLSDLINSLERQFDEANGVFREILKCSTERLSSIAKTLGNKSIKKGRIYHAAKISVEQSQDDCQRACVQFEQANKDHQIAKKAIQQAELKLKEVTNSKNVTTITTNGDVIPDDVSNLDLSKLKLNEIVRDTVDANSNCSTQNNSCDNNNTNTTLDTNIIDNAAKLSEELNQAIQKLIEAEKKREMSERQHLDMANKLMISQEKLVKLEREYGQSIKRSLFYFDEAERFNAKLKTIKDDIDNITKHIIGAKQAYARTLNELEQFSDDLHVSSMKAQVENNYPENSNENN